MKGMIRRGTTREGSDWNHQAGWPDCAVHHANSRETIGRQSLEANRLKRTLILLLCFFSLLAIAQKPNDASADVIALENAWTQAELRNDAAALGKLVGDAFFVTQPDGSIQTKAETLAYVGDKTNHWDAVASENMKVHVDGDTAVVTGTYHEKGASAGKPFENNGFFTDTWVRRKGKWLCIAGHDSYAVKG
jgi:ketosteroid isomerase-like protein